MGQDTPPLGVHWEVEEEEGTRLGRSMPCKLSALQLQDVLLLLAKAAVSPRPPTQCSEKSAPMGAVEGEKVMGGMGKAAVGVGDGEDSASPASLSTTTIRDSVVGREKAPNAPPLPT